MSDDFSALYEAVVRVAGGEENISSLGACMTRLRFTLHREDGLNPADFKQIPGVLGYVRAEGQHQLVLGPAKAGKAAAYFLSRHPYPALGETPPKEGILPVSNAVQSAPQAEGKTSAPDALRQTKAQIRRKYSSRLSALCAKIGNIFVPLIPAYIGCGLLLGIGNILSKTVWADCPNACGLLNVLGSGIFFYLNAIVGYNAAREFGATAALGAALAGVLNVPALANITLFGMTLVPGKGGVIAVLAVCWVGAQVEKALRKWIKGSAEMFLTPTLTILSVGVFSLLIIQPAAGWLSDKLAVWTQQALQHGGAVSGAILGGGFLPLVMLGVHQSLIPLHQQLLDTLGNNPLFPVLCMAGTGQVGAGLAVLLKTKNPRLKTVAKNALPVGLLGIGEPLIYGVTLPLFKPFIAACIGAAAGGAVVAVLQVTSAIAFGVSGVVLLLALSNLHSVVCYAVGFLIAVLVGFFTAWKLGFDDPAE